MYAFKGGTMHSIDNMRTFAALYLRPNDEGGGHFVYNVATMQKNSACRVIGINKKPIPMTDLIIDTINKQAKEEKQGIQFSDINKNTTVTDYAERDNDSDFEDDDKSYKTSTDSTLDGNNKMSDDPDQLDKDQQQHFNIPEVNDINEDYSDSKHEGVGDEGVGEEGNLIRDDDDNNNIDSSVHNPRKSDSWRCSNYSANSRHRILE